MKMQLRNFFAIAKPFRLKKSQKKTDFVWLQKPNWQPCFSPRSDQCNVHTPTNGFVSSEILRVVDSLQLTANHQVATPADWQVGIFATCLFRKHLRRAG